MIDPASFLETPVGEHLPRLVQEAFGRAEEERGRGLRFGPYRVVREVGRGGMGTVYEARRADRHYDRRVAIKTVAALTPHGTLAHRLEEELRILAGLEHPGIARLYDAGATEDGVPFVVMEFVDGRRIDVHCREDALPVEARLELFDRVCEAVEYAHSKLVVHRDLKPGNILVTSDGVPKLLDFGVARLLDPVPAAVEPSLPAGDGTDARPTAGDAGGEEDPPTLTGLRAVTPEYASPEQLRGEPVTTSSDVYALGVLLYLLLTDRRPYRPARRTPEAVERLIREAPAGPPSAALEGEARSRRGRITGDLDAITLTAMHPDVRRRYSSVGRLRRDLADHRAGLPVSVGPEAWTYRARKFVRRHRAGVVAAGLIAVSAAGGLAGTTWQARSASRQAERAERTRDYLVGLFESFDPDADRGPVTAEELLDRGVERLSADLAGQPVTRAELGSVLGGLYARLGLYGKARSLLDSTRVLMVDARGEDHPETAVVTARLASVLYESGAYEEAEPLARRALEVRRRLFGGGDTAVAHSLGDLAAIRGARGHWEEGRDLHEEALAIYRRSGSPEQVASSLDNLGVAQGRLGARDEAVRLHEEALAVRREAFGERSTRVATSLLNLGAAHRAAGAYDEAERLLAECIALRRELLGDGHPHLALALAELGGALQEAGRLEDAEAAHLEAMEIRREAFGSGHPTVAASLNSLGVIAYFRGDYRAAAARFEQVLPVWREQLGDDHPSVLVVQNNLGSALREAGEYAAAEAVLREVLSVRRRVLGDAHPDIGQSLNNLAVVLHRRGATREAESVYREAIRVWEGALGADHPTLAFGLGGLGRLLLESDRAAEAEAPLRRAASLREAALDPESPALASSRAWLAFCLMELGKARGEPAPTTEARALLDAAAPVLEERWGPADELVRRVAEARAGGD